MLCTGHKTLCVCATIVFIYLQGASNETTDSLNEFDEPKFDISVVRNVTVHAGNTANLNCRVFNLEDRSVTWIRHRDLHLLTVGDYVYIQDSRFHVFYNSQKGDWTLSITDITADDGGIYECQVNTNNIMKMLFQLTVIDYIDKHTEEPDEEDGKVSFKRSRNAKKVTGVILGDKQIYVAMGEPFNLTCLMQSSRIRTISVLEWLHNETTIEKSESVRFLNYKRSQDVLVSHAYFDKARETHSGVYFCRYGPEETARVNVWVVQVFKTSQDLVSSLSTDTSSNGQIRVANINIFNIYISFHLIIIFIYQ